MQSQHHTAIIGNQTYLKGNIAGTEGLTVAGRVEGSIRLSDSLVVESSAVVKADIQAKAVVIHGTVVGDIKADEFVQLTAQARVVGDVITPRLMLAEGAAYKGSVNMSSGASAKASKGQRSAGATPERSTKTTIETRSGSTAAATASARAKTAARARAARSTKAPKPPTTAGKKSRVRRK